VKTLFHILHLHCLLWALRLIVVFDLLGWLQDLRKLNLVTFDLRRFDSFLLVYIILRLLAPAVALCIPRGN
jgi:hypothetical protein